jgi:predicted HTH domain antitoxin
MALVISDEFLSASELTSSEFLQEIALHLFRTINFRLCCEKRHY